MAEAYGGTGITAEEKEKGFKAERSRQLQGALTTGAQYAAIGASGGAIGAGVGFLIGAGVGAFTSSGQDPTHFADIAAKKKQARSAEDASRLAQAAAETASKGSGGGMRQASIPSAPSSDSVLMSSMPIQRGASRPMDPYRQTVLNRFGWS